MFFEKIEQIPSLLRQSGCTILVMPVAEIEKVVLLKTALRLEPSQDMKTQVINVDQVRELMTHVNNCEAKERFFLITPADTMNEPAQNAMLKTLEEPHLGCHFVLVTERLAQILPTIRSRSQIFVLRQEGKLDQAPEADAKTMELAKRLIAANTTELISLATELAKTKTRPREKAQAVVETAIEILYKAYFKTGNAKFLLKLPKLLNLQENLANNCHLNLHLVADLL